MIYKVVKQFPIISVLFVIALIASVRADGLEAPTTPAEIAVPEGNQLFMEVLADGVQIYACKAKDDGTGYEWSFTAPEATLRDSAGTVIGKHYAGPSWEASDGSKVVGKVQAKVPSSDPTAIHWLLLATTSEGSLDGKFAKTTFIQRLETVAGIAPTNGCDEASTGQEAKIPYTATYYFYEAE
jgi:FtsP/CotA-like multicopper oxidase with cupredoxin domain